MDEKTRKKQALSSPDMFRDHTWDLLQEMRSDQKTADEKLDSVVATQQEFRVEFASTKANYTWIKAWIGAAWAAIVACWVYVIKGGGH
jgi:hypothetical protein